MTHEKVIHCFGLFPGAYAITFNSTGERRLPKGFGEFRSQVLSLACPRGNLSYELAYMRNRTSALTGRAWKQ